MTAAPGLAALPALAPVPGGRFVMGKDGSRADEAPAHEVVVGPLFAGVTPVTNAQYAAFIRATGAPLPPLARNERFAEPGQPAVGVSWFEAVAYCEWLSAETGHCWRLPTEAEREFASLGGLDGGDWPWPAGCHPLASTIEAFDRPHEPLAACANGYGLRCMADNVHEWCGDWYDSRYYAVSPLEAPAGPATGTRRASRGGSWRHREKVTRVNARSSLDPAFRYSDFGFRVFAGA
jgi:formylglycine-generating enzyme required for sulfatase activity